jgi:DNA repair protein RadC
MPSRRIREAPPHTIQAMSASERPRERLQQLGASVLSDAELIAIVLRTGVKGQNVVRLAQDLLDQFGRLGGLARVPIDELARVKGVGPTKATELHAVFEIGRRAMLASLDERPPVRSAADAVQQLKKLSALEQEEMHVLLLDTKNRLVGSHRIYEGSVHTTVIRVGELFREAIRKNCTSIIVAHNHPSGDPTPSPEDVAVTQEMVRAGKILDIDVLDHVVIGAGSSFTSLKERGLGF